MFEPGFDDTRRVPENDFRETVYSAKRNDDLSRQVRNLLLLLPVARIELEKHRLGPANSANPGQSVFDGIDTLYLSFSLFDFISEKMVFRPGATRGDIVAHLSGEVGRLNPGVSKENAVAVSEIVLDRLCNSKENHRSFSFSYFDALPGANKVREFRLVAYTVTDDTKGWYYLTNEGFAAYLSMLGLDSDVAREVDAYLIRKMIERGKFSDALRHARSNRKRTVELKERLNRELFRIERDIANIDWDRDVKPFLDESRNHVKRRIEDEGMILESLPGHIEKASDADKKSLIDLQDEIRECQRQHDDLHRRLMGFNDKFRDFQLRAYKITKTMDLPDLEHDILSCLAKTTVEKLNAVAPDITLLMNPPVVGKIFDPLMLLTVIENHVETRDDTEKATEQEEIIPFENPGERFGPELKQRMEAYMAKLVPKRGSADLKAVVRRAEKDGLSNDDILCLVYLVMELYGDGGKNTFAFQKAGKLKTGTLSGDNLSISRQKEGGNLEV